MQATPEKRRSAQEIQDEIFRRMTPQQRVECVFQWTNVTLEFSRAGIRADHPDWSAARVEREVFRRATGIDLEPLFGPLPQESPSQPAASEG